MRIKGFARCGGWATAVCPMGSTGVLTASGGGSQTVHRQTVIRIENSQPVRIESHLIAIRSLPSNFTIIEALRHSCRPRRPRHQPAPPRETKIDGEKLVRGWFGLCVGLGGYWQVSCLFWSWRAAEPLWRPIFEMPTKFDIADICAEDALLLCCARTRIEEETANQIKILIHHGINWRYLVRSAIYHRVAPLLYQSLRQTSLKSIPPAVANKLQHHYKAIAGRNLFLTAKLLQIIDLLEAHHIPAIPYKGPALAFLAYGDVTLRQFGDLDILVHPHDYLTTQNLFLAHGYRLAVDWGWECSLVDNSHGICVDLHQGIMPEKFRFHLDFQSLQQRLEALPLAGGKIKTIYPEDMLLILCIQLVKDGLESNPLRLIKVCDIAELLQKHPDLDWERVLKRVRSLGCPQLLLVGLSVTHRLLGTPVPELPLRPVTSPNLGDLNVHICHKIIHKVGYHRFNLTLVPNERDRALLTLPESLSALYYFIRPIRLTRDYSRLAWYILKAKYLTWKRQC